MSKKRQIIFRWISLSILGGLVLLTPACSRRPKGVLGEKEMVSLMADLQLADAYSSSHIQQDEDNSSSRDLKNGVLAKHGVSQEQLDTTLGWYGKNLDEYVELYAKVEKELHKRRRNLMKDNEQLLSSSGGSDLWPFTKNSSLVPLSYTDGLTLSIPDPDLQKGDRLVWSFHLSENVDLAGQLGVEYTDGSGEASIMNRGRNQRFEMTLQTDTGKTVNRLYAVFRVKDRRSMPVFADSIKLEKLPYDSLEYKTARSQKRYGKPVALRKEKSEKDSLKTKSTDDIDEVDSKVRREVPSSSEGSGAEKLKKTAKEKAPKNGEKLQPVTSEGELKWQPRK